MSDQPGPITLVTDYFKSLQASICETLSGIDGSAQFSVEDIETPGGGHSRPRVIDGGEVLERGAVQFTHSIGAALPPAASERNPHLAGQGFQAAAISMIMHPQNPFVPTFHANLRYFVVGDSHWYFGGGFDLTPFYPFMEDVIHWHATARDACAPFGDEIYPKLKAWCDEYFFLPHRQETRGVGGVFFDDWSEGGFDQSLAFVKSIGDAILPAYQPILERRLDTPYTEAQKNFSCIAEVVTPNSTWRSTVAPNTASNPVGVSSPCWHLCRHRPFGSTTGSQSLARTKPSSTKTT